MSYFLVVGAINRDLLGRLTYPGQAFTSNPCYTRFSFGGVAFNVARQLGYHGNSVKLVSALGIDHEAQLALEEASKYGIDTRLIRRISSQSTAHYYGFCQNDGSMLIAFSDMSIINFIEPDYLATALKDAKPEILIIDANLSPQSCLWLINWAKAKKILVAGIGVCVEKTRNFLPILAKLDWLIVNKRELLSLTTTVNSTQNTLEICASFGIKNAVITDGNNEISLVANGLINHFTPMALDIVVDSHGAGDAFAAGFLQALIKDCSIDDSIQNGMTWALNTLKHWGAQP